MVLEGDKKEFAQLFGDLLKAENILRNFDEFESFEKIISDRQMPIHFPSLISSLIPRIL